MSMRMWLLGVAVGVVACGGSAKSSTGVTVQGGGGAGGLVGDGSVADDASMGTGGRGGASGASTGGRGQGGEACAFVTEDRVRIEVVAPQSTADAGPPAPPPTGHYTRFQGRVSSVAPDRIEVDTCISGDASCGSERVASVTVSAHGLDLGVAVVVGALVDVQYVRDCPFGCTDAILVTGPASVEGVLNPVPSLVYFAAAEGTLTLPSDSPFTVAKTPLSCILVVGGGPHLDDGRAFTLTFGDPVTGAAANVAMGMTTLFYPQDAELTVRNLRSYEISMPDRLPDIAWWVSSSAGLSGGGGG